MMKAHCPTCGDDYELERDRVLPLMVEKPELFKQRPGNEEMYAEVECLFCDMIKGMPKVPLDNNMWKPDPSTAPRPYITWTTTTTISTPHGTISLPKSLNSSTSDNANLPAYTINNTTNCTISANVNFTFSR